MARKRADRGTPLESPEDATNDSSKSPVVGRSRRLRGSGVLTWDRLSPGCSRRPSASRAYGGHRPSLFRPGGGCGPCCFGSGVGRLRRRVDRLSRKSSRRSKAVLVRSRQVDCASGGGLCRPGSVGAARGRRAPLCLCPAGRAGHVAGHRPADRIGVDRCLDIGGAKTGDRRGASRVSAAGPSDCDILEHSGSAPTSHRGGRECLPPGASRNGLRPRRASGDALFHKLRKEINR